MTSAAAAHPDLDDVRRGVVLLRRNTRHRSAARALQALLADLGFHLAVDGAFGPITDRLLRVMQVARGVTVDGILGPNTMRSLDAAWQAAELARGQPMAEAEPSAWQAGSGEPAAGLYRHDRFPGLAALSFDDGPRDGRTQRVLATLARFGLRATFYVMGSRGVEASELVRQVVAEGHHLGNHSWDHTNFQELSDRAIDDQIALTRAFLEEVAPEQRVFHVRPPYGAPFHSEEASAAGHHARVGARFAAAGVAVMMWQVDTWDWRYVADPVSVVARFIAEWDASHGGSILAHDIQPQLVEALPGILDVLRQRGVRLVTEAELLATKYRAASAA